MDGAVAMDVRLRVMILSSFSRNTCEQHLERYEKDLVSPVPEEFVVEDESLVCARAFRDLGIASGDHAFNRDAHCRSFRLPGRCFILG